MELHCLLQNAQEGDEVSVIEIYLKFQPAIKNFSRQLNYEESETDLIIALLELITQIDLNRFPTENDGYLVNFIYKFLKNKSINLFKKNVLNDQKSIEFDFNNLPDNKVVDLDSIITISIILNTLPLLQREVIKRKFIQEFTENEISKSLGISRQAVNRAKNRGLTNLRKKLYG